MADAAVTARAISETKNVRPSFFGTLKFAGLRGSSSLRQPTTIRESEGIVPVGVD